MIRLSKNVLICIYIFSCDASVTEEPKTKERCSSVLKFAQSFSTIVVSPLFMRHRNIFFFCMEFFAPALIALIIFAAFTSGISWRQVHYNKVEACKVHPNFQLDHYIQKSQFTRNVLKNCFM